jgi:putative ATPase
VFVLNRLGEAAIDQLLRRAEVEAGRDLPLDAAARTALGAMADGDGRYVLNLAEELLARDDGVILDTQALAHAIQRRAAVYDKSQDGHFNLISALHKSLRGSDPDAALYWLARMFAGGEDPRYLARRLTRFASEDVGLADPQALVQALAAWQAYERLGSPEGELAIAQCVVYLATAPKSNALYRAHGASGKSARNSGSLTPPKHILNAPTSLMRDLDYGAGYAYDHDTDDGFSGQDYFPDGMARQKYYEPVERGFEREIVKRLAYWDKLRRAGAKGEG